MTKFSIITKPNCKYCDLAKDLIKKNGDTYKERVIGVDIDTTDVKREFPDATTVPLIRMTDRLAKRIGGYSELLEWYKKNANI